MTRDKKHRWQEIAVEVMQSLKFPSVNITFILLDNATLSQDGRQDTDYTVRHDKKKQKN